MEVFIRRPDEPWEETPLTSNVEAIESQAWPAVANGVNLTVCEWPIEPEASVVFRAYRRFPLALIGRDGAIVGEFDQTDGRIYVTSTGR